MANSITGSANAFSVQYTVETDKTWTINNPSHLTFTLLGQSQSSPTTNAIITGSGDAVYRVDVPTNSSSSSRNFTITTTLTEGSCSGVNKITTITQNGAS